MTTQQILTFDNSRMSNYKECPREYFLSNKLNWISLAEKPPLVFGGAWHEGKAAIFGNKTEQDKTTLMNLAMNAFHAEWTEREGPTSTEDLNDWYPRIPSVADTMYSHWLDIHWDWLQRIQVLEIEKPFAVPLYAEFQCPYCLKQMSESYWHNNKSCPHCSKSLTEVFLVGRRDAVIEDRGKIYFLDSKTSSLWGKVLGFQNKFIEQFKIDSQIDGYYYTTLMTHGECEGGIIDASCTMKNHHDEHKHFMEKRTFESLYAWFSEACIYVNRILNDEEKGPKYFTRNSKACSTPYGFCGYYDVCRFYLEPWNDEAQPMGYKIEKWEPFDEAELRDLILETRKAERKTL